MIKDDFSFFKMQMETLCSYLQTDIDKDVIEKDYWPFMIKYDKQHFCDAVQWIKENYEYKRYPLISDFKKAFSHTYRTKYVKDTVKDTVKKEDEPDLPKNEIREFAKKLADRYTTPEQKKKKEARNKQRNMYKRMDKEKMVWSYKLHKWVHEDLMGNIGGGFIIPRDKLKEFKSILPEEKL